MDFDEYEKLFRPDTTVGLNWELLRRIKETLRFEAVVPTDSESIGRLGMVWASPVAGRDYVRDHARPEAPFRDKALEAHVNAAADWQRQQPEFVVPAYQTGMRPTILLDGSHRAIAAARGMLDQEMTIVILFGPDDPIYLVDLAYPDAPLGIG